tara:strand:- start:720 stop:944 length:225 start_codon:yes stop_codon:yes gene_type:complete
MFRGLRINPRISVKLREKLTSLNAKTLNLSVLGVIIKVTHKTKILLQREKGHSVPNYQSIITTNTGKSTRKSDI